MKIIQTDNRLVAHVDDRLVAHVRSLELANQITELLNSEHTHPDDDCYYIVVGDNYTLQRFEP